jgi:hypothetical protein
MPEQINAFEQELVWYTSLARNGMGTYLFITMSKLTGLTHRLKYQSSKTYILITLGPYSKKFGMIL